MCTVKAVQGASPKMPDWERMERARILADQEDYRRTTPGQRVELAIELSRELTALAARGRKRARSG